MRVCVCVCGYVCACVCVYACVYGYVLVCVHEGLIVHTMCLHCTNRICVYIYHLRHYCNYLIQLNSTRHPSISNRYAETGPQNLKVDVQTVQTSSFPKVHVHHGKRECLNKYYVENVEATVSGFSPVFDALYLCNSEVHHVI